MSEGAVRTYPHGVSCLVELDAPEPDAVARFYGALLGWSVSAPASDGRRVALLDGREVASITCDRPGAWVTYISVTDLAWAAAAVLDGGGTVLEAPHLVGDDGRAARCVDPSGAAFGLWEPLGRPGAQVVNVPGAWNFSHLRTSDAGRARAFYAAVFGWEYDPDPGGFGGPIRVAGYGDHLAATVDPDIHVRQASAPPGFADVIGGVQQAASGEPAHWHVQFSVADRDAAVGRARELGAEVLATSETPWTRLAELRDPAGAEFTVSQFTPPG